MDKKELQSDELNSVSGRGYEPFNTYIHCRSCRQCYDTTVRYPKGFLFRVERDGCSYIQTYKCPVCGFEWK